MQFIMKLSPDALLAFHRGGPLVSHRSSSINYSFYIRMYVARARARVYALPFGYILIEYRVRQRSREYYTRCTRISIFTTRGRVSSFGRRKIFVRPGHDCPRIQANESTTECNYSGNRRASRDCTFCPFIIKNPRALREWQYLRRPAFFYPRAMVRLIFHLLGNPSDYITPRKRKSWRKASPLSIRRAPRGLSCVLS